MSDETWVVTLPKLGESVTEGVIGSVFKQVGDEVEFDDPLFEVSTDKVDSEVPSPYDGVVLEVLAQPGETIPVGAPVLKIGGKGTTVENRLPSAAHGVAAAGGRSLNDPSAPSVGGSEGPSTEDAHFSPSSATGEVFEITMPKLGESVTEGTIGTWLKAVGDDVAFDDPLFDVSTDKVDSEIPSPYDGKILDILVNAGETVPVGTVLARIGAAGSQVAGSAGNGSRPAAVETPRAASPETGAAPVGRDGAGGRLLSPLVRRLAAEHGIDVTTVPGTGVGGRIRREDIAKVIAAGPATAVAAPSRPGGDTTRPAGGQGRQRRPGRSGAAQQNASDPRGHAQGIADARGIGVDICGSGLRQCRTGAHGVQGAVQEGDRCVVELSSVHLSGGLRRTARIPDGQLIHRPRIQDNDAAPLRQLGGRGRSG